jgi:hypothetical protein
VAYGQGVSDSPSLSHPPPHRFGKLQAAYQGYLGSLFREANSMYYGDHGCGILEPAGCPDAMQVRAVSLWHSYPSTTFAV